MKTNLSQKALFVLAFLSITMFACTKDQLTSSKGVGSVGTINPVEQQSGTIVDLGLVSTESRKMVAILRTQNFAAYGSNGEVLGDGADIKLAFYSNEDGYIPGGLYTFSNTDNKEPFSFDSGFVTTPLVSKSEPVNYGILSGTVIVTRDVSNYSFEFQLELTSGVTFTGSFKGQLNYSDAE